MKTIDYTVDWVLEQGAARSQSGVAFRCGEEILSYGDLISRSGRLAQALHRGGLAKGDKVALAVPNSLLYPVAFFGIQRGGGVAVPIHPGLTFRERDYVLEHSDALWVLSPEGGPSTGGGAAVPLALRADGSVPDLVEAGETRGGNRVVTAADDGLLIYTSGTTGVPKGVLLSHGNIVSNAHAVSSYLHLNPGDRHAVFLPLFYSYAISQMLSTLVAGGEVVLLDGFLYPALALEEMGRLDVTVLAGVPTTYNLLVRLKYFRRHQLPGLRLCLNAGGPIHPDRLEELRKRFPQADIVNNYGCTEAGPRVTYLPHRELHRRGSIGVPIPGVEVTLRDEQGREAGPGEMGEIHISGPGVMKGYYKNEVETRRVLTKHGFRSGDWATRDADGFLFFKGRKLDIINTGGEKVSAREVEDVLMQHPGVKEVAVVGAPDPILGEIVKAFVVPESEGAVTEDELLRLAAKELARHKVPRRFELCKNLARTPSGKIRKIDLIG